MPQVEVVSVDDGEVRDFAKGRGRLIVAHLSKGDAGVGIFPPGWSWEEHVKPIAGTDSCQVEHFAYVKEGRMIVNMDDGTETEVQAGDFVHIPPGHGGRTVGNVPCVMVEFGGAKSYAR